MSNTETPRPIEPSESGSTQVKESVTTPSTSGQVPAHKASHNDAGSEPRPKRKKRHAALVVAILALVTSIVFGVINYLVARSQIEIAREQLQANIDAASAQAKQLEQSGPLLSATARLWVHTPSGEWRPIPADENATGDEDKLGNIVLEIEATNEGRFQATVKQVGLGTSKESYRPADVTNCYDKESGWIGVCKMPLRIAPQESAKFYVDLDSSEIREALTCNEYVRSGLEYVLATTGSPYIVERLPKSIYYAWDCK